jgi:pimeloyl-ACP methyl ester carboxylesterase
MQRSAEGFAHLENGIDLCYDTFGDPADPPVLLVMGLAGPLNWWSPDLCWSLARRGFFVIRFDNRDVGRSTKLRDVRTSRRALVRSYAGFGAAPYTLSDMADDAFGLLDHLGIERAHVTGVSMGGMIAQTMAIEHPERVRSLVSIMSSTGRRSVGWQHPRLLPMLLARGRNSREGYIRAAARTWAVIGSPGYPPSPEEIRDRAGETYDRGISLTGVMRQMHAVVAQPDRTARLRGLTMPAMVIHGLADKMVHVSGGRATAHAIAGCELMLIPGMGHDLPEALWPVFVDAVQRTAKRASVDA